MTITSKVWFHRNREHDLTFGRYQLEIFTKVLYLMFNYINIDKKTHKKHTKVFVWRFMIDF